MGARKKLNSAYFVGSLIMACLVGWVFESWMALIVVLVFLVSINLYEGDIRLGNRHDRPGGS